MTAPMNPGSAAASSPKAHPQRAAEPALFRITTTAPDGQKVAEEVVDREELDERLPALLFVTDQLSGWNIAAEPIT